MERGRLMDNNQEKKDFYVEESEQFISSIEEEHESNSTEKYNENNNELPFWFSSRWTFESL